MPGRPRTRARREAEARSPKRFDAVARAAVLKRSEEVGPATAAREAGIAPGTLRTWRKRAADAPEPAPVPTPEQEFGSRAERLRAAADKARAASSRALDQADSLLARGLASEARNASVVSGVHAERAQELESAARIEEAHSVELSQASGRLVLDLIERAFGDVGLPAPTELVRALLGRWPAEVEPEAVDRAKDDVRRTIRAEVRAELLAEMDEARLLRPALAPGEAPEDEDDAIDAEVVEDPDPLSPEAQERKLEEFRAEFPGEPEKAERRWRDWIVREEHRAEYGRRRREDEEQIGVPDEDALAPYLAESRNRETALERYYLDRRVPGEGSKFAGHRPSSVAVLREAPVGNSGGLL